MIAASRSRVAWTGGARMRDVLDDLSAGGRRGRPSAWAPWWPPGARRRARPAPRCWSAPTATAVGSVSGGCVEGAVYEEAKDAVETGVPTLRALRRQRRRRLRRGPDLRRDPRRVRRVGLARVVPRAGRRRRVGRPRTSRSPSSRWSRARRPAGPAAGALARPGVGHARACSAWTTPSPPTPAGMLAAGRTGLLHVGHDGERRGDDLTLFVDSFAPPARMVVFGAIDFAAAVARVGAFLGYRVTVCDARPVFATAEAVPRRARGGRRVAAPLPAGGGRRRPDRRAHRALRAHPRPEVRRPAAGGGAAHPGRLRRRDGLAAARTTSGWPGWPRRG